MQGTLSLAKAEISRLRRNKRYLIFTVALPVMFYLVFGKQTATAYNVGFKAFYMVGMASFGAFSGAFNNNAIRISQERKDGWIRQLRLTPLPANAYVVAKILASLATTVPSIVIVFLLGRFYGGVQMPAWKWIAVAVAVWFGTLIFAALAVAIGYRFDPDSVQPVAIVIYFFFSIFGGLWFPLSGALKKFGEFTPTYQVVKISTDVIGQGSTSVAYGRGRGLVRGLHRARRPRRAGHRRDSLTSASSPAGHTGARPGKAERVRTVTASWRPGRRAPCGTTCPRASARPGPGTAPRRSASPPNAAGCSA